MTTAVQVSPMQWARLRDIDDVEPLNPGDYDCLAEIRDVLKRHGMQERFGVALLHKHFDLADGETMMEVTDKTSRVLTIRPVKEGAVGESVETIWMLRDGDFESMRACKMRCVKQGGNHTWEHVVSNS